MDGVLAEPHVAIPFPVTCQRARGLASADAGSGIDRGHDAARAWPHDVAVHCAEPDAPPHIFLMRLRPADDDRVPMACGDGADCAAMPGACAPEGSDSI